MLQTKVTDYLPDDEITHRQVKEKLYRHLVEKQRRWSDRSLYYFVKYTLGYKDIRLQPHWEMTQFISRYGYKYDTITLCPRGTFKSTVITIGWVLWIFTKNRDLRVCIDSAKQGNAKNWLGVIQRHCESNSAFRAIYGDWLGTPWTTFFCSFSGRKRMVAEHSIVASSPETAKISQHYDVYLFDDVQIKENVTSKEMIDKVEEHCELSLPILDPQEALKDRNHPGGKRGPRVFVGTRWHDDDIYGRMIAKEKRSYLGKGANRRGRLKIYNRAAAEKYTLIGDKFVLEGKLFFPDRFGPDYLEEIQSSMGLWEFSCNYLNDPLPEGMQIFKLSRFGWWNESGMRFSNGKILPLPGRVNLFTTIDPSLGEHADSDYSAFLTVGVDTEYNWLVQEVVREHLTPDVFIEQMFTTYEKWKPFRFALETVAFQKALLYPFQEACRTRNQYIPVEQLQTDTRVKKDLRIRSLEPYVNAGKVFFPVDNAVPLTAPLDVLYHSVPKGVDVLLDELVRFPRGKTDDCADAMSYMPQLVFPASRPGPAGPPAGALERILARLTTRQEHLLRAGIR